MDDAFAKDRDPILNERNNLDLQPSSEESLSVRQEHLEQAYADCLLLPSSDEKVEILSAIGIDYHEFYQQSQDPVNLDHAVSIQKEVIQLGHSHPQLVEYLGKLSNSLKDRYDCSGDRADIDEAIQISQKSVNLTQQDAPERADRLMRLASNHCSRFMNLGDVADINVAISTYEEAVALLPDGNLDRLRGYNNLGMALQMRFERLGYCEDLERAVFNSENALNLVPNEHSDKAIYHNNLGNALRLRFERLGDLMDLEEAISNNEIAVNLAPDGHPDLPLWYNNLGESLQSRFERLGSLKDLEKAISNKERAANIMPDGHRDKASYYGSIGRVLQVRFDRLGDLADLERAISNYENAANLTPDGHPDKPLWYSNLGIALKLRFERLGDLTDLERAISNEENAVNLIPDGHPDKPLLYNNLGSAYRSRFERLGDLSDLERAFSNSERAVTITPDGHPDKVDRTLNLATCYEGRFNSFSTISDLSLAYSLYGVAAQSPVGHPRQRIQAASAWSRSSKLMNTSPLPAFKCAIDQLPRIAWHGIPVSEQHSLLGGIGGVVRDAVAAAIEAEEYIMAVEWVEQGRSIVWQNLLNLRAPVDDVHAVHPGLANRLQSISQQLGELAGRGPMSQIRQDTLLQQITRPHSTRLALEWDQTIDQIRTLPGFESFLRPKVFDTLAPAAYEDPVIILNVAKDRCDALALTSDGNDAVSIVHIPLENFSFNKSLELSGKLTKLLALSGVRDGDTRTSRRVGVKANTNAMFKSILHTLWVDVAKPVMDGLAYQPRTGDPSRIWWCATGPLGFLPIHAAGDYDALDIGHKLSDYVASSFTPTLSALLDPTYQSPSQGFKLLTVAQPSAPGLSDIPKTMDEVEQIAKVAIGVSVAGLTKEEATVERVLQGMRESSWVHLACHGKQDASKPIESGLMLYDGTLKLSTIVKESLPNAEFAFLSACQTAMGDQEVTEESVHLAAGMLLAGYKGVIATMWSIRDDVAPRVAEVVYGRMLKDGVPNRREAAHALHDAVKQLRDSGADFTSWVPFIHIGR